MHKKGVTEEVAKKRTRRTIKSQRGVVGASVDLINTRRNQKPEVREAARKEHIAKTKEAKKARQTERKANRQAAGASAAMSRQQAKPMARGGPRLKQKLLCKRHKGAKSLCVVCPLYFVFLSEMF